MTASMKRTRGDMDKDSASSQSKRTRFAILSDQEQEQDVNVNAGKEVIASNDRHSVSDLSQDIKGETTNDEH
jgi:hypothetical protein